MGSGTFRVHGFRLQDEELVRAFGCRDIVLPGSIEVSSRSKEDHGPSEHSRATGLAAAPGGCEPQRGPGCLGPGPPGPGSRSFGADFKQLGVERKERSTEHSTERSRVLLQSGLQRRRGNTAYRSGHAETKTQLDLGCRRVVMRSTRAARSIGVKGNGLCGRAVAVCVARATSKESDRVSSQRSKTTAIAVSSGARRRQHLRQLR
eukprot:s6187_g4.t1